MTIPNSTVTVRLPPQLIEELDKLVDTSKYRNRSDAIIQLIQVGLELDKIKTKSTDPNFIKYLEEMRKNGSILEWASNLSTDMLGGIKQIVEYNLKDRWSKDGNPLIIKIMD